MQRKPFKLESLFFLLVASALVLLPLSYAEPGAADAVEKSADTKETAKTPTAAVKPAEAASEKPTEASTPAAPAKKEGAPSAVAAPQGAAGTSQQPQNPVAGPPRVKITTNLGSFTVELNPEKAPITVKNFLAYVDEGYYSGTIFHRVISGFMIQGGGFTEDMKKKKTKAPIVLEAKKGLSNLRGTIAMARTSNPNSATSQFFINVVNNRNLDSYGGGYAVFGKVIEGMEVVDQIRAVKTAPRRMHRDVPVVAVVIKSATRL